MAGAAAGVSTAGAVGFMGAGSTPVGFMGAGSTPVGFTGAGSTAIDFTMADSATVDFTITGFSSVDRLHIPGWAFIRTMAITITANPTPRRLGTTVPILPAITPT
jgi:hypothetical protein